MKASFALIAIMVVGLLVPTHAQAQTQTSNTILPTATKITYTTNTIEIADSVAKKSVVVRKNDLRVQTVNVTTGATATLTDKASGRPVWSGAVSKIRIVGLTAQTDSLKVVSLKTSPFN